jgi:hypothetical protein
MNDLGASIEVSQKPSLKKTFDASVGELNPQRLKKTLYINFAKDIWENKIQLKKSHYIKVLSNFLKQYQLQRSDLFVT